ncbi:hypothetical protein KCP75_01725 [Salmonella enterica subsp. enterica]|nr:hypothetical protein KCP75_01725 [Salmonella enterica subsp. enterica]
MAVEEVVLDENTGQLHCYCKVANKIHRATCGNNGILRLPASVTMRPGKLTDACYVVGASCKGRARAAGAVHVRIAGERILGDDEYLVSNPAFALA